MILLVFFWETEMTLVVMFQLNEVLGTPLPTKPPNVKH